MVIFEHDYIGSSYIRFGNDVRPSSIDVELVDLRIIPNVSSNNGTCLKRRILPDNWRN